MTDDLNLSMFRAYDIRTPSDLLTPDLAERLARAEAVYFRETLGVRGVVVAHDARSSGPSYLNQAVEVFLESGLDVRYVPGAVSTSHFYFTAIQNADHAGVMFGASHNPAGDTGQKILGPGVRPIAEKIGPDGGLDRIQSLYREGASSKGRRRGKLIPLNNLDDYILYSMDLAGVERGSLADARILHDYVFGAGGREMMLAFDAARADLRALHFAPDGRFPLGDPNPVKPGTIREGLETLRSSDAFLGTFFDGDADRIDFYAGDGRYLSSSFVYAGILPHIVSRLRAGEFGVFADLKSNPLAVIEMAKSGVFVNVIRNGHSQIKSAMFDDPRIIGTVEESAHFYQAFHWEGQGPFCTENTLYIALLVTRAWKEDPDRFESLFEIQGRTCREREWGHYFPTDADRAAALADVQSQFEAEGAQAIDRTSTGLDLEATLMRRGLPFDIDQNTQLAPDWLQVCQRISQSENGLARWEVVAATPEIAAGARDRILETVGRYGASEVYRG